MHVLAICQFLHGLLTDMWAGEHDVDDTSAAVATELMTESAQPVLAVLQCCVVAFCHAESAAATLAPVLHALRLVLANWTMPSSVGE